MVTLDLACVPALVAPQHAPDAGKSVVCAGVRHNAREFAFTDKVFQPSLCQERLGPFSGEVLVVAKRRGMAAERVRVVLQPSDGMPTYDPEKPDPRLRDFVRLLARQAARKFVEAEREGASREHLPD